MKELDLDQFTTIVSQEGKSRNISWTVEYFPSSKVYYIYHVYSDQLSKKFQVTETLRIPNKKYVYHTRPFDSVNILFEVRNITTEDAGYYVGGGSEEDVWSQGGGVVLVVSGKPEKPKIRGILDVKVGYYAYLKCESRSTSTPHYYKKFSPLLYFWFVNNTRVKREEREKYRIIVTKEVKYNRYSCQAKETIESERSKETRINPLYGPESIIITPKPLNDTITLKDGDPFGPYNCSADCNPPCTLQWKYKHPSGDFANVTSYGISPLSLPKQIAERTRMTLIRCVASNSEGRKTDVIKLKILYLLDPQVYINEILQNSSTLNEGNPLSLICHIGGNPTPEVTLRKHTGNQILWQKQLNYTLKTDAQCSDTSTYSCDGKSTEFGSRSQSFYINVSCEPRLDNSNLFKSICGSLSGPDVNVHVSLPFIANPLTSSSGFTWSGPTSHSISTKISQRDNVIYKHWINSTIPIPDRRSFGNYSLKYKRKVIANITIKAEDKPQPPLNFSWYSYDSGYINLTWVSNFNGGPEQIFILSMKEGPNWRVVKNLTDPGEGNMGYYDLGSLSPGHEYLYRLESCNRINCSFSPRKVKVKVQGVVASFMLQTLPASSFLFGNTTMIIVIGASIAAFGLVVILTLAMTMYCKTKKSTPKKRNTEERLSGCKQTDKATEQDNTPVEVVVYAAVDKAVLLKNRQEDDVAESDTIKNKNDDNGTLYSENQDGLVYIDVEFTKKPQSSDTNGRPVIHGEEERTEYTFVDFSKKAPPKQEQQDNTT
ncbi:uncharacterized protein LOC133189191 [Saccostrea echinata]|uniref:uncharacterized protein LOC133189191 n=1 Tax=Saccostrea echinata TaxID=191078 RepID=UPI002A801CCF|nr:uncharacterized protein LOC133189191 [Saccostrea echinata]